MVYRMFTYAVSITLATVLILASTASLSATLRTADASTGAHAVSLADASFRPDRLAYVRSGQSVTFRRQCGGRVDVRSHHWTRDYFTEISAYRWNGARLSPQMWSADQTLTVWVTQNYRPVTFDGLTFRNGTTSTVIVAGWCS